MSLFRHPTAASVGAGAFQRKQRAIHELGRLDRFAEMLSREVHPEDAAERLGCSRAYGRVLLKKLKDGINAAQRAAGFGDWA